MFDILLLEHDYGKESTISINKTNQILKYYISYYKEIKQLYNADLSNNLELNLKNIYKFNLNGEMLISSIFCANLYSSD